MAGEMWLKTRLGPALTELALSAESSFLPAEAHDGFTVHALRRRR